MKAWNQTGLLIALVSVATWAALAEPQLLTFEVVSVKEQPWIKNEYAGFGCRGVDGIHAMPFGARGFARISLPQGRCRGEFAPLAQVIGFAYGVLARDVVGGPDWVRTPYDNTLQIEAKAEETGTATTDQLRLMLQTLLKERFQLETHHASRDEWGYAMTLGRNGTHKLKQAVDTASPLSPAGPGLFKGATTLQGLADILSQYIGAPIQDQTGLTAKYDVVLVIPLVAGTDIDSPIPDAIESQLGVRLERRKVALKTVVIDRIEKLQKN